MHTCEFNSPLSLPLPLRELITSLNSLNDVNKYRKEMKKKEIDKW